MTVSDINITIVAECKNGCWGTVMARRSGRYPVTGEPIITARASMTRRAYEQETAVPLSENGRFDIWLPFVDEVRNACLEWECG